MADLFRDAFPSAIAHPLTMLYGCLLDNQPEHLVPTWLMTEMSSLDVLRPLVFNPVAFFQDAHDADNVIMPDDLYRDVWTIWVPDPATRVALPYVLGEECMIAVQGRHPGDPMPAEIPIHVRQLLAFTSICVEVGYPTRRLESWQREVRTCRCAFSEGFAPIRGLIHPFHLGALRRHYRRRIRKGAFRFGDAQCPLRFVAHNEPIAGFFHHQLTSVVSQIVGHTVKPSYVYFASYQNGARLPKHIDRAQCEYTLALSVDFAPEPAVETPWPLQLELPSGRVTCYQALGDALLFRGRSIPHFRHELPVGCTSTSLFFHYVDEGFNGSLV